MHSPCNLAVSLGPRLAYYMLEKGLMLTHHQALGHPLHSMLYLGDDPWHLVGSHQREGLAMLRHDAEGYMVRPCIMPA